jgi:hypothetical protein
VESANHELPQEQDVPLAAHGDLGDAAAIHRAVQRCLEKFLDAPGVEPDQLKPLGEVVLPQRRDRLGRRFAGPDGHQDEGALHRRQLVDERRRGVVEEMGVVDEEHETAVPGAFDERCGGAPKEIGSVVDAARLAVVASREKPGQGTERECGSGPGCSHSGGAQPGCLGDLEGFGGEARLAHSGRPGDDHAGGGLRGDEPAQPVQLRGPPHERPIALNFAPHAHSLARATA